MTAELSKALLGHLTALFAPITSIRNVEDLRGLLDRTGWDLDALAGVDVTAVVDAAQAATEAVEELADLIQNGTGELTEYAGAAVGLTVAVARIVAAVKDWAPPAGVSAADLALLPVDLLAVLLDGHLRTSAPRVAVVLDLLGVLRRVPAVAVARPDGIVLRRAMDRPEVDTTALTRAVTDPVGLFTDRFLADAAGNRRLAEGIADLTGPLIAAALAALGAQAAYGIPGRGAGTGLTADELAAARHMLLARYEIVATDGDLAATIAFALAVGLTDDTAGRGLGVVLAPSGEVDVTLGPVRVTLAGDPGTVLVTGSGVDFDPAGTGELALSVGYTAPGTPAVRFGAATGTRFELGAVAVSLGVDLSAAELDVGVTVQLGRILLAVAAGDGDGFLAKVLPAEPIEARADLVLDWSLRRGLTVHGSGSLEIRIAAGLVLGPITLDEVALGLTVGEAGLGAQVGIGATLAIGPLVASIQGVGLRAALAPPGQDAGSVIAVGFKPPTGIGFVIDAGPVKGGGLVSIDEPAHQYVGILQLDIAGVITVTAIGLLTTRMPDGSDGFSLLVIITVEFPPIQLGFGFQLLGLGGLVGIHRTFVVETLRDGVRTGALGAILFPKNPVANATQLIATLKAVFPPAAGHFVFGPMIKLGWGPNQIIALELGLLIELPSPLRLVIIGRITAILPDKKAAVVQLRLDVLGVLDLAKGEVSVDASLIDSRIAAFTISGDMALRVGWKATKVFALAVGGFHPKFVPPPGFPALRRLAISLATGDNPRLRLETYFAITSNTVQFGGRLDLAVAAGPFSARAYAGLDALIEFVPFSFSLVLSMGIDIAWDGQPFLHAQLEATLTGPTPWHAFGFVEFQVLCVTARLSVDLTTGVAAAAEVLRVLLADLLTEALSVDSAWTAELPPAGGTGVAVRADAAAGGLVMHPLGRFTVRQRVLPLDTTIDRYGAARPAPNSAVRFGLTAITVGGAAGAGPVPVHDDFAAAQFADLADDEKLSRPAFEELPSGARAGLPGYRWAAGGSTVEVTYDEAVVNADEPASQRRTGVPLDPVVGAALARDGLAGHSTARAAELAGPRRPVAVVGERYLACPLGALPTSVPAAGATSLLQGAAGLRPGEQLVTVGEVS